MGEILQQPLVNLAAGAFLTYLLAIRRSRREEIERLFNEAMAAVVELQASRHIGSGIPSHMLPEGTSEEELKEFKLEIAKGAITMFVESARSTRLKLAAVYPYCPEVRPYFERFEIAQADVDEVLRLLREARKAQSSASHLLRRASGRTAG